MESSHFRIEKQHAEVIGMNPEMLRSYRNYLKQLKSFVAATSNYENSSIFYLCPKHFVLINFILPFSSDEPGNSNVDSR